MDRKSVIVLLASVVLMMLWFQLVNKIWPPTPLPAPTNRTSSASTSITGDTNTPVLPPPALSPTTTSPEELLRWENTNAVYTFTSLGGGLKVVEFKQYPAVVACRGNEPTNDAMASVNTMAPVPILALTATEQLRTDDTYQLSQTGGVVVAQRLFENGLHVTKTFRIESNYVVTTTVRLENQSAAPLNFPSHEWVIGTSTPTSHEEDATHLGVYWYSGSDTEHVDAGWFANRTLGCFPGTPRPLYVAGLTNVVWGSVHNQFFAMALVPKEPAYQVLAREIKVPLPDPARPAAATNAPPGNEWFFSTNDIVRPGELARRLARRDTALGLYLTDRFSAENRQRLNETAAGTAGATAALLAEEFNRIIASDSLYHQNRTFFAQEEILPRDRRLIDEQPRGADLVRLNRLLLEQVYKSDLRSSPLGYQAALSYPPLTLAPGQVAEREFLLYAGPREYNTLARLGDRLDNDLDSIMGYGGFFGFFAKILLLSMNGLHGLNMSYALAIITITVIIKLLFWPLTNASTKSMKRMAALQPQMKALQEKYKDDPAKMNRKLMEFMKENRVSPLGGCLPMLLQLPVFFGFFTMIRSAIELRGARFLWVCDLSQPDTLFVVPGLGPFNLLPLIMGVTMLWQARLTPPSPGMDPTQQKIMRYMPLMFLVILYNFSAGLTLYWTVQNLLTIAQMKLTKARDAKTTPATTPAPVAPRPQPRKKK